MKNSGTIRVAILGTGKIASDLAARIKRSSDISLVAVAGRRPHSEGLERLSSLAEFSTAEGLAGLSEVIDSLDGVFDATSAFDHPGHWHSLQQSGKWVVDLTPSRVGKAAVPALSGDFPEFGFDISPVANYSMVTCGGQSGSPIAAAFARSATEIEAIEVSSSIASDSAGPATRQNIDNYVMTTEWLMSEIAGGARSKAILVLNPADPPPLMRTTVTMRASRFDTKALELLLQRYVSSVQKYVPGYSIAVAPHSPNVGVISATAVVEGEGYFLPKHAGNLDIINASSIEVARQHVARTRGGV